MDELAALVGGIVNVFVLFVIAWVIRPRDETTAPAPLATTP